MGEFRGDTGQIRLTADLFKPGNEHQLAATLAHEIGHLVDWLPHKSLKRGNILGRLFSLRSFLKSTFIAADGSHIENKKVKAELTALSNKWRPWDEATASASFAAYRSSSKEIFADAISVLLNNPGLLEQDAPIFYEQFFSELDNKPDVKRAYFDLQELLSGTREDLIRRRRARVDEMFSLADAKALDIERLRQQEQALALKDVWFRLRLEHVEKNAAVVDRMNALEKTGVRINPDDDPRYLLEERTHLGSKLHGFTAHHFQPVYEHLESGGVGWARFREALLYERIIAGDRSEVANPLGLSPASVPDLYEDLKRGLDPEQRRELADALKDFRAGVQRVVDEAHDVGLYSDEQYAEMKKNPAYATYRVVDYLEKQVTSRVRHQVGTLKDIADVGVGTILKSLVTLRAIEHQRVKLASFKRLEQLEPGSVEQAKEVWAGKGRKPIDPPDAKKQKLVTYYENGRLRGKWVDPYIADSLNNETVALNSIVLESLKVANGRAFRPLFVTFNTGFQTWNVQRDFWRFWKNMPEMSVAKAVRRYRQAHPLAKARAFGVGTSPTARERQAQADLREAEEARILTVTMNNLLTGRTVEDTEIEDVFARMGVLASPHAQQRAVLKPFRAVLDWIKKAGDYIETLPKAAAMYEFAEKGGISSLTPAQRSHIRRRIGTPDVFAGGTLKPVQNELLLFSNVYIQGFRSDLEMATAPTTRAGWWWKTAKLNIAPKLISYGLRAGLISAAMSAMGFGDDDDDEPSAWASRVAALERIFQGVTEYDATNYTTVPLGFDTNGKPIYWKMPVDDFGRVIGGLTWKTLRAGGGEDPEVLTSIMQILDYTLGQFPGLTPTFSALGDVKEFAAGGRVYDDFRGRFLLTEDEAKARDWRTVKKFIGYEFQQVGGAIVWKFYPGEDRPEKVGALQKILEFPIVSNIVGRSIRVTDFGAVERLREVQAKVQKAEARQRLAERDAINDAIRDFLAMPDADQTPRRRGAMAEAIAEKLYPDDRVERAQRLPLLRTKLRVGAKRGEADPVVDAVLAATSTDQKVALIREAGASMTTKAFQEWLQMAVREQVISREVAGAVRRDQLMKQAEAVAK
jgi:hypothetical protein